MKTSLAGTRVLVVEDEMLVAMLLEEALQELGCKVIGPVSRVETAQTTIDSERFDCALLDINLRGKPVYPVAELLAQRSVPFGFVTGYGDRGVAAPFEGRPVLQKPFHTNDLARVVACLADAKAPPKRSATRR